MTLLKRLLMTFAIFLGCGSVVITPSYANTSTASPSASSTPSHKKHKVHTVHHTAALPVRSHSSMNVEQFEREFLSLMHLWRIPGAALAVMKNNKLLYVKGFGYADVERKQPTPDNALFRIASMSKSITAAAVLQLVQAHKISLESRAFDILNDLKPLPGMRVNPAIYKITVRDLLEMSSGWDLHGKGGFDPMFGPWPKSVAAKLQTVPASCERTAQLMMGMPLQFQPGTRFAYSNFNYCVLGLIISKVTANNYSSESYVNYVQQHILHPLGITDMQIAHTSLSEQLPNEVHYYSYYDQPVGNGGLPYSETPLLENNYADGGWLATAYDVARFASGLVTHQLLSDDLISEMTAPPSYVPSKYRNKYFAMAWQIKPFDPFATWMKTGSFTGSNGFVVKKPDGTVYAVIFNTRPDGSILNRFRTAFVHLISSTHFA